MPFSEDTRDLTSSFARHPQQFLAGQEPQPRGDPLVVGDARGAGEIQPRPDDVGVHGSLGQLCPKARGAIPVDAAIAQKIEAQARRQLSVRRRALQVVVGEEASREPVAAVNLGAPRGERLFEEDRARPAVEEAERG